MVVGTRKRARGAAQAMDARAGQGASKRRRSAAAAAAKQKQPAASEAKPKVKAKPAAKPAVKPAAEPTKKGAAAKAAASGPSSSAAAAGGTVTVNRAPVLTLWVAVVAQRQGYSWREGLTFGRWVSGVLAQSKGRSLGLYEEREKSEAEQRKREKRDRELGVQKVDCFGMHIPAALVGGERHAVSSGQALDPASVQGYLQRSFGTQLEATKAAMEGLAGAVPAEDVGRVAYRLYERFRPAWKGWGAKSQLHLHTISGLAHSWQEEEGEE